MKKILFTLLLVFTLTQQAFSLSCDDGYYVGTDTESNDICRQCSYGCAKCEDAITCSEWQEGLDGVQVGTNNAMQIFCLNAVDTYGVGYDLDTGRCQRCADGCLECFIDYDACASCRGGWEYNRERLSCYRAETGLGATILAVSIIMLLTLIFTCCTVKKK